jgi:hypothetical protein
MNNNTPKNKILQEVISEKEIKEITTKYGYCDTGRKLTVYRLCQYYMVSAMEESKSQRELATQGKSHGLVKVDHTSLSKKSKEVPYEIYLELCGNIIAKSNRSVRRKVSREYNRIVKAIDSTRIIEPSNKWEWASYKQGHSGIKLHVSHLPESGLPSEIFVSEINVSDSSELTNFGDSEACLLADRGFMSIQKMCELDNRGQEFVVRMLNHTNILNTIDFDPSTPAGYTDVLCTLGKCRSIPAQYRNHQFRVVSFDGSNGETVTLCTNIVDLYSTEIADLYRLRWSIETFFKTFKQNFQVKRLFGTSRNAVFSQAIIAFLVSTVFAVIFASAKHKNLLPANFSFVHFVRLFKFNDLHFAIDNTLLWIFC